MATEIPYTIRPGTPRDGPGLLEVHRRSILELGRQKYSQAEVESWATGLTAEGYGRVMTEGGEAYAVAVDRQGVIVGFCSIKHNEVVGLYIGPDWVRRGVGGALLRGAEATMIAAGYDRIWMTASLTGQPFYEAHGYRLIRHRGWETRGGLVIDVLDMEKVIL